MKQILFVISLSLFFSACGKDGAAGPAGPQGAAGANGTDNKIVASIHCSGEILGLTGAAGTALNGLWIYYDASLTNAGDVFAAAAVVTPSFQIGGTNFYSAKQNGALTASVIFTADLATANGGWWKVSLDRSTLVTTAVYTDASLGGQSPVTMTFLPGSCTANSY